MRRVYITALLMALICILCKSSNAYRDMPTDNLGMPVLITFDSGASASGFNISYPHGVYLVTARHVLFSSAGTNMILNSTNVTLTSYPYGTNDAIKKIVSVDLESCARAGNILAHPLHDVAVVKIAVINTNLPVPMPKVWTYPYVKNIEGAAVPISGHNQDSITKYNDVLVSNEAFIFGFPRSIGLKQIPQIDYDHPLLRKGIIAGKNNSAHTLIIDTTVYYGNSGGPVQQVEHLDDGRIHYTIVGVISQMIPFAEEWVNTTHKYSQIQLSNSGYAVAVPMDFVEELIMILEKKDAEQGA